ncbi:MAG: DMT family transporter [Bacillota bacterium]
MNKTQLGYLYMILSAASFASMSVFMKQAYGLGMTPWTFSVLQSLFALAQLALLKLREPSPAVPRPPVRWQALLLFAVAGAGAAIAFNVALVHLSISLGSILLFTYPAFVALGAWLFLHQRPGALHLAALAMTLVGTVLTVDVGGALAGTLSLLGIGLALLSALSQGVYILLGERIGGGLSPVSATILTRLSIMTGSFLLYPRVVPEILALPGEAVLVTLAASLVGGVAPFLFLYKGIALIGANRAAIVSVVELPFALVLGRLFQGDQILPVQLLGALLIGAAVVLSQSRATTGDGAAE